LNEYGSINIFSWCLDNKATNDHEMCEDIKSAGKELQEKDSYTCNEAALIVEKMFEKHNQNFERFAIQTSIVYSD